MLLKHVGFYENPYTERLFELFSFLKILFLNWWQRGSKQRGNVQFFDIYNYGAPMTGQELWTKESVKSPVARVYKRYGMKYHRRKMSKTRELAQDYRRLTDLQWQFSFQNWQNLEEEATTTFREFIEGWDTSVKIS